MEKTDDSYRIRIPLGSLLDLPFKKPNGLDNSILVWKVYMFLLKFSYDNVRQLGFLLSIFFFYKFAFVDTKYTFIAIFLGRF